mmetsp:Transcript_1918/g.4316  ORF Transcript_1918/g.4316 Transcript_1918/m.4316 type:complete len:321 (-) Transcript_1918:62-1024(-)
MFCLPEPCCKGPGRDNDSGASAQLQAAFENQGGGRDGQRQSSGADGTVALVFQRPFQQVAAVALAPLSQQATNQPSLKSAALGAARELCAEVDHELKISQQEVCRHCSGSAPLSMLWARFTHACEDQAFREAALEASPEPGAPSISFMADISRHMVRHRFGLGCADAPLENGAGVLLVTGVERGSCVEAWNNKCAKCMTPWKRVHLCTAIISVNGHTGCAAMREELARCTHAEIVACSPPTLHDALFALRSIRAAVPLPPSKLFWTLPLHRKLDTCWFRRDDPELEKKHVQSRLHEGGADAGAGGVGLGDNHAAACLEGV